MYFENIVVGNSLSAVLFAHYNEYHLILNSKERPFAFDTLDSEATIGEITTNNHRALWNWLVYNMSLNGLAPFGPDILSLREAGEELSLTAKPGLNFKIAFDKCYIFEDDKVTVENQILKEGTKLYRVFDWMDVRSGSKHSVETISTGEEFVSKVYFYKSERIDGNHNKKDLVAVSLLTESQLAEFNYSDTMAKFKVQSLMKVNNITGRNSGKTKSGDQMTESIKVEPSYRHTVNLQKRSYEDSEKIKFIQMTPEEIIKKYARTRQR